MSDLTSRQKHAREQFFLALVGMLPETGGWNRSERQSWFDLCAFLVDWFYVIEEDAPSLRVAEEIKETTYA